MARRRGRPPKRKTPTYHLGKASSLPGDLWPLWLAHVLKIGPTWLYVALLLSHLLCLRVTEVLRLQAHEFDLKNGMCKIKALKRGAPMTKHILSPVLPLLKNLRGKGIRKKRTKTQGVRGSITYWDGWKWPEEKKGYLSQQKGATLKKRIVAKIRLAKQWGESANLSKLLKLSL